VCTIWSTASKTDSAPKSDRSNARTSHPTPSLTLCSFSTVHRSHQPVPLRACLQLVLWLWCGCGVMWCGVSCEQIGFGAVAKRVVERQRRAHRTRHATRFGVGPTHVAQRSAHGGV
jgi:hypothetical protein